MLKTCRICHSKNPSYLYPLKNKFSIYHCSKCNTDLIFPVPTIKDIARANNQTYFEAYDDESIKDFKTLDLQKVLSKIPSKQIKSALDVGCANAYLVEYLLSKKVDAYGIELFPEVAKRAQKKFKEKRIFTGDFLTYKFNRKFDLIIMFDLLEHTQDPSVILKKAKELLNTNGYITIITPDISAFKRKILGRYWTAYYIEHMQCFSLQTIKHITDGIGLKFCEYFRFSKTVNVHYFIRHIYHKFSVFSILRPLTKIPFINFNFSINDDSMLIILQK